MGPDWLQEPHAALIIGAFIVATLLPVTVLPGS